MALGLSDGFVTPGGPRFGTWPGVVLWDSAVDGPLSPRGLGASLGSCWDCSTPRVACKCAINVESSSKAEFSQPHFCTAEINYLLAH